MNLRPSHQKKLERRHWTVLWLTLVLVIMAAIRLRLINMPFERDEGELAYGGQLLLHGISPYKGAYTIGLKLPGTCAAYALAMAVFGEHVAAIRLAIILVTLATAIIVFLITRRICGDGAGVIAAGTYALLSINPMALGLAAHATHFVMLPAVAGILLLMNLSERTSSARIFCAGLLLGLALLMKQTGAVFGLFAAVWVAWQEMHFIEKKYPRLAKRLGWLALGGCLPFALTCALIIHAGDWPQFWLWTFKFATAHAGIITFSEGMKTAAGVAAQLFMADAPLCCLALAGIILLFFTASLRQWRFFIFGFAVCSAGAVYPGWRNHYFIQFFPVAGLLAGVAFHALGPLLERLKTSFSPQALSLPIFVIAMLSPLLQWAPTYFTLTPTQVLREIYSTNPFPEAVEIGRYLEAHCPPNGRIAVLGSEPEIYFYSHRRAATGYICTYPLMEPQPYALAMQKQMIQEIESAHPDYVVFVAVPKSWLQFSDSNPLIFNWFKKYQQDHLRPVGLVEIPGNEPTVYHWFDSGQPNVQISARCWIVILKKK